MVAEAFSAIIEGVQFWKEKQNESIGELRRKKEAIALIMEAVVATKAYLYDLDSGSKSSRDEEKDLSSKWMHASMAISEYDQRLYTAAKLKALGWADPGEWKKSEVSPWLIKLDIIMKQCDHLYEPS